MKIQYLPKTNLFTVSADAYAQGVNCKGKMGRGVARQFRIHYPLMYLSYTACCARHFNSATLCGTIHTWYDPDVEFRIYNLFTQHLPGKNAHLNYVRGCFNQMFNSATISSLKTIAIPDMIGCGIGGLEREDVVRTITESGSESYWKGTLLVASIE